MIGTWEILLIVLMILILFGANKIPEFIKSLNSGIKEFREAAKNIEDTSTDKDEVLND